MSDSEGSDSDGSYGGRKKMRRDEAEEVRILKIFLRNVFYAKCRVRRRMWRMSRSQRGKILLGGRERMTVMRRFLLNSFLSQQYNLIVSSCPG